MALNVHDTCPHCGAEELIQVKNVLRCPKCSYEVEIFDSEDAQWLKDLNAESKEQLWEKQLFAELPALLGHEYSRLKTFFERGMVYAAIIQMKDVYEVTMKLAVLCSAAYMRDPSVTKELVNAPLSVGHWEQILSQLAKISDRKPVYSELPEPLLNILISLKALVNNRKIFVQGQFSTWRNEFLGHGALGFSADERYRKSLTEMSLGIAEHYKQCRESYASIKMLLNGVPLKFDELRPGRKLDEGELTVEINGSVLKIEPFARQYRDGVYLFDSLKNQKAYALNYVNANKKEYAAPYFNEIYQMRVGGMNINSADIKADFTRDEIEHQLNRMNEAYDFIKPKYIAKWLEETVCDTVDGKVNTKSISGGVLHLMMEQGMGKTSVVFAMDDQYEVKDSIRLTDTAVRAFYCSKLQIRSVSEFADGLRNELRRGVNEHNGKVFPSIAKDLKTPESRVQSMVQFLTDVHEIYSSELHIASKLMIVLDGLDEIPQNCSEIFDYIPDGSMLPEGVYVMLTSRNPKTEKLAPETARRISKIKADSRLTVLRKGGDKSADEGNKAVLRSYIQKLTKTTDEEYRINVTDKEIERLLELSDYTFLNLVMYIRLVKAGHPVARLEKMANFDLLKYYLEQLREVYGEKMFGNALKILCVILTAKANLTLDEISHLSGRGDIDLMLLAYMKDIAPFIRSVRSSPERGTEYKSANENYAKYFTDVVTTTYNDMVEFYRETLLGFDKEEYKDEKGIYRIPDHISYIAAYIGGYGIQPDLGVIGKIYDINFAQQDFVDRYILERRLAMCEYIKSNTDFLEQNEKYKLVIRTLNSLGNIHSTMAEHTESLNVQNQHIEMAERYLREGKIDNENDLAAACMNRGVTYDNLGKYTEALADHDKCIEIRERLYENGKLYDENDLASAYMNRGGTYWSTGKSTESLADYEKCIEITERLNANGKLYDENDLASAYMNRGTTYAQIELYPEALEDYGKCIEIRERLKANGKLYDIDDIGMVMLNKGLLLLKGFNDSQGALDLFEKAIAMLEAEPQLSYSAKNTLDRLREVRNKLIDDINDENNFEGMIQMLRHNSEMAKQLIEMSRADGNNDLADFIEAMLKLFDDLQ